MLLDAYMTEACCRFYLEAKAERQRKREDDDDP